MGFRTKLDYSNNRQISQYQKSHTNLSGGTSFGMVFSALTAGPDLTTKTYVGSATTVASTFSGNSASTVYNWYDARMGAGLSQLSAITPSTSATTQNVVNGYSATTYTVIDGNVVNLTYNLTTFDLTPIAFTSLGGGNYSGTVQSNDVLFYSAGTLDYTGRTIWVDVSGITRTNDLIITNTPVVGSVLTCLNSEGKSAWVPASAATSGIWVVGSGINSARLNNANNLANGDYSVAEGRNNQALGVESHAEGDTTIASGNQSHSEGNSTTASGHYSHAENLNTIASGISSHAEGDTTVAGGYASHAGGLKSSALADYSMVHGSGSTVLDTAIHTVVLGAGITGKNANTTYIEQLNIKTLGVYSGNTAAVAAGLDVGAVYRTATGQLMVRF